MTTSTTRTKRPTKRKLGHDSIRQISINDCRPSPENDHLYRPVDEACPDIRSLADSISQFGVREPIVLTLDGFILSGHRRHAAARVAGLVTVPVRYEQVRRSDDLDEFVRLLREYNRQREKTRDERLREEVVSVDADQAYQSLIEHRERASDLALPSMQIKGRKQRAGISAAKRPLLDAILGIITERRKFWPLSDRQIHYALLNDPPLRHARKPESRYRNDGPSYRSLVELLTRARLAGLIDWAAIADETRPVTNWKVWNTSGAFAREQVTELFTGYWRDLMQSQPNQIEIIGEKNTVRPILESVAAKYCIPLTTGRGYCSIPPRHAMAERYRQSGKQKLILLMVSDFDPDGEEIAHSFARSMRDDFGIAAVHPVKVALTAEQVAKYELPPILKAKKDSTNCKKFVSQYGDNVFELEALQPERLQRILQEAIDAVIDIDAFNAELEAERQDAVFLEGHRRIVLRTLGERLDDDAPHGDVEQ